MSWRYKTLAVGVRPYSSLVRSRLRSTPTVRPLTQCGLLVEAVQGSGHVNGVHVGQAAGEEGTRDSHQTSNGTAQRLRFVSILVGLDSSSRTLPWHSAVRHHLHCSWLMLHWSGVSIRLGQSSCHHQDAIHSETHHEMILRLDFALICVL